MNIKITLLSLLVVAFAPAVSASDAPLSQSTLTGNTPTLLAENRSGSSTERVRTTDENEMSSSKDMQESYQSQDMNQDMIHDKKVRKSIHHKRA
ncbi:hypothetical protein [Vibrio gallicus]|uniref:hypothetical protein n=1 Tax=Vibrio gallicus TaxID=190897 RepID=UPI0021C328C0|nr:hypothetical protein [Vibrio gallicus]